MRETSQNTISFPRNTLGGQDSSKTLAILAREWFIRLVASRAPGPNNAVTYGYQLWKT